MKTIHFKNGVKLEIKQSEANDLWNLLCKGGVLFYMVHAPNNENRVEKLINIDEITCIT